MSMLFELWCILFMSSGISFVCVSAHSHVRALFIIEKRTIDVIIKSCCNILCSISYLGICHVTMSMSCRVHVSYLCPFPMHVSRPHKPPALECSCLCQSSDCCNTPIYQLFEECWLPSNTNVMRTTRVETMKHDEILRGVKRQQKQT